MALLGAAASAIEPLDPANNVDLLIISADGLTTPADDFGLLHPSLRVGVVSASSVATAFGPDGELSDTELRTYIAYAVDSYATGPTYVLLLGDSDPLVAPNYRIPTHHSIGRANYGGSFAYADDRWLVSDEEGKSLVLLGRIAAPTMTSVLNYLNRAMEYIGGEHNGSWNDQILVLLGDMEEPASEIANFSETLLDSSLSVWPETSRKVYSASAFEANALPEVSAPLIKNDIESGVGLLYAYGNVYSRDDIAWLVDLEIGSTGAFIPSVAPTNRFPFVIMAQCLGARFDHALGGHSVGSPAEEVLLSSATSGGIGVIAPTQIVHAYDSFRISEALFDAIAREGIRECGRILEHARQLASATANEHDLAQYVLLGDPALEIVLPEPAAIGWRTGFELTDRFTLQNTIVSSEGSWSSSSGRVLRSAPVAFAEGGRAFRVSTAKAGSGAGHIEWKIAEAGIAVVPNTHLYYRSMIVESAGDLGRISIDGLTTRGTLGAQPEIRDQSGARVLAELRPPVGGGWTEGVIDLTQLSGETLVDLRARVGVSENGEVGNFVAYFDDVEIIHTGENEIVNGGFERDSDDDTRPDAWNDVNPLAAEAGSMVVDEGYVGKCILLPMRECSGTGVMQVISVPSQECGFVIEAMARSSGNVVSPSVRLRALLAESGVVLGDVVASVGEAWESVSMGFGLLSCPPNEMVRVRIEITPVPCDAGILVDEVSVSPLSTTSTSDQPRVKLGDSIIASPGVIKRGGRWELQFSDGFVGAIRIELIDALGRLVAQPRVIHVGDAAVSSPIDTRRLPAGRYFVRATSLESEVTRVSPLIIL